MENGPKDVGKIEFKSPIVALDNISWDRQQNKISLVYHMVGCRGEQGRDIGFGINTTLTDVLSDKTTLIQ
jgi:hypothetical protein